MKKGDTIIYVILGISAFSWLVYTMINLERESESKVDSKHKGGHMLPTLEFRIDVSFAENKKKEYLGWIYNKHPDDIYLETSLYEAMDNGSYKRKASGGIRIPGAATWINERQQECFK